MQVQVQVQVRMRVCAMCFVVCGVSRFLSGLGNNAMGCSLFST